MTVRLSENAFFLFWFDMLYNVFVLGSGRGVYIDFKQCDILSGKP